MDLKERELISDLLSALKKSVQINKELLLKYSHASTQLSKYQARELQAYSETYDKLKAKHKELASRVSEHGREEEKGLQPIQEREENSP